MRDSGLGRMSIVLLMGPVMEPREKVRDLCYGYTARKVIVPD
jgi:hypothetical protein